MNGPFRAARFARIRDPTLRVGLVETALQAAASGKRESTFVRRFQTQALAGCVIRPLALAHGRDGQPFEGGLVILVGDGKSFL